MVKGIFCHDLPIYKDVNGVYCSTTLTDDLFSRYFHVVDELIVATRVYNIDITYVEAHQERVTLSDIRFLDLPNVNTCDALFKEIPEVRNLLKREIRDVDLVFIRGGTVAKLGVDAAKSMNKPYLMESSGCAWDTYWNHSLTGKLIAPYMEYREKRDVCDAAFVIYVTERWLQNRYPTKGVSTFASNVILSELDEKALIGRMDRISQMNKDSQIIFGTIGGVNNKAKGQQFMIEAMSKLKDKYDIRYELVGSGETNYLSSIANKFGVRDKVVFKGQLTHEEVLHWLDSIDIYIQPSMQEGLPRALIEAMSRACPAIGSTTAGIPELLDQDAIFKRGNVSALSNIICHMIDNGLKFHANRNFDKAKEYQIDLLNARREKIYEQYRDLVVRRKMFV